MRPIYLQEVSNETERAKPRQRDPYQQAGPDRQADVPGGGGSHHDGHVQHPCLCRRRNGLDQGPADHERCLWPDRHHQHHRRRDDGQRRPAANELLQKRAHGG